MKTGKMLLPDGTEVKVETDRRGTPRYEVPHPWKPGTWFVVPTDRRASINWDETP